MQQMKDPVSSRRFKPTTIGTSTLFLSILWAFVFNTPAAGFSAFRASAIADAGRPNVVSTVDDLYERQAASLPHRRAGYPLIANYNGFLQAADVPAYAYNALIVAKQ